MVIANETSESGSAEAESHSPVAEDANQESNEDNEEVLFVRKKKTPEAQDSIQKQEDGEEEPKEESNGTQTDSLYELDLSNSQQTMDDVTVFEPIRDSIPNLPPKALQLVRQAKEAEEQTKIEEANEKEKHAIMVKLLHSKLEELLKKQEHINSIQSQIANLDAPAAKDVAVLRDRIDKCSKSSLVHGVMRREHDDVEKTYEAAVEAYESVRTVQSQLEEQKSQLEEKKEVEYFEFKNWQLQKLKMIEEEIRDLL